ncbi:MAG: translation elongation factor Ts [Spirochaetes bacterium RBG_13_68_11]|nr:MAG: translation elongation factor Ts [Spirochaetes bacterium RBG_13_68_11]
MDVSATDLKRLREKTGAGMLDCRNALVKSGGDFDKAERLLKEQGLAAAAKRTGRATGAGKIFVKVLPGKAVVLELDCETDFVVRNELFQKLGNALVDMVAAKGLTAKTDEMELMVKEAIGKIKENMAVPRFTTLAAGSDEMLVDYTHYDRIGVVVKAKLSEAKLAVESAVRQTLFECALHLAAFAPQFLSREKVPAEWLKDQEAIFQEQVKAMNKPANVLQGIVKGKVAKLLSEVCFLEQPFVKDEKRKVAKVLEDLGKQVGGTVAAVDFVYYKVGEAT